MFTGIVEKTTVSRVVDLEGLRQLTVVLPDASNLKTGASIAVNGTCLTVVYFDETSARFDVMAETLTKTNLGQLKAGDTVNIERSLRAGDEIGGHHVSGHVDMVAHVDHIVRTPNNHTVHFAIHNNRYLIEKGFIAVDGISLTVVDVTSSLFSVSLIPETLARTTLGEKDQKGDCVNIEFDSTTKTIVTTMERLLPDTLSRVLQQQPK